MAKVVPKLSKEVEDFNYLQDLIKRQIINLIDNNKLEKVILFLIENPFFTKNELINLNILEQKANYLIDNLLENNIITTIKFNNKNIYSNKSVVEYYTKYHKYMNTKII